MATNEDTLLLDEPPLVVSPSLAEAVGIDAAHFLQQVHYWLRRSDKIRDGRRWIYNSYEEWREQFRWMSVSTLSRVVKKLEAEGLLITANYNALPMDRTKWYAIDYDRLSELAQSVKMKNARRQNEKCNLPKWQDASCQNDGLQSTILVGAIPGDYTETTAEINQDSSFAESQKKHGARAPKTAQPKAEKKPSPTLEELLGKHGEEHVHVILKRIEILYGMPIPHYSTQAKEATALMKHYKSAQIVGCWEAMNERDRKWIDLSWEAREIGDYVKNGGVLPQRGQSYGRADSRPDSGAPRNHTARDAGADPNITTSRHVAEDWEYERSLMRDRTPRS